MNINERINYLFNTYKPVKQRVLEFADIDRKSLRDYMVNGTQPAANTADKILQFFRDIGYYLGNIVGYGVYVREFLGCFCNS